MRRPVTVRVVGPAQWIVIPALIAVAGTVILATPIKLFGLNLPEPVLPVVLAFAWPVIRPSVIAPLVLGALGLFLDVFWGGALGLWPLALMAVYGLVLSSRSILSNQETQVLFAWYAGAVAVAFALGFCVVTLQTGNMPSLIGMFFQMLPTILMFPLANLMIQRFDDGDVRFR